MSGDEAHPPGLVPVLSRGKHRSPGTGAFGSSGWHLVGAYDAAAPARRVVGSRDSVDALLAST